MRQLTEAAKAAKMIRQELKKAFPSTKFSVTSSNYSMGDSVRIDWTDGVTTDQVNAIVRKYQYGSFDGMTDSYNYTNSRNDIPQAKYVQTHRRYSEQAEMTCFEEVKSAYHGFESVTDMEQSSRDLFDKYQCWTARNFVYRILVKRDLTQGAA
jgi:glyceraldehyde-3-phosphate dehydrogenase/erythrose-4-phosphate dehydrogenase